MAISISLEANELIENFQWRTSEEAAAESKQNIKEEMADVFIYLLQLADKMNSENTIIQALVERTIHR